MGTDLFATPQRVADCFFLLYRNVNGRQRTGATEDRELADISTISLDAITGR
jgi:hypothetical protein